MQWGREGSVLKLGRKVGMWDAEMGSDLTLERDMGCADGILF